MKLFKNVFGTKKNKKEKFEGNTLAETNGSPDLRLATTKEKEADVPIIKQEAVKKIPKKSDVASAQKAKPAPAKATASTKSNGEKATVASEEKASSSTKTAKKNASASTVEEAKKTASQPKATAQKTAKKPVEKAEAEVKATAAKTTKKASAETKSTDKKVVTKPESEEKTVAKKPAAKSASKATATVKDTKKEEKPAPTAQKKASTTAEKATVKPKVAPKKDEEIAENDGEVTVSKSSRTGKFEIKKSKDGRFVFNLYASNNVIVATSQIYSSSTSAMNGIKSVISNAATAPIEDQSLKTVITVPFPKWEIYLDKGEQYRFRLCASNGSCVCHSQGYTSKANCKKGIESIIKFASDAEITKAYLEKKEK